MLYHTIKGVSLAPKVVEEVAVNETKAKVHDRIVGYLDLAEGYPTEYFKEAINELVYAMVIPIVFDFRRKTGRKSLNLQRERGLFLWTAREEFLVVDLISVTEDRFVFIIEEEAYLERLRVWRDRNGVGKVYGSIATGDTIVVFR